ncbi:hypothetical protein [Pseudomonas amygdali]|uniref:hypothetical protein n=1 Tax=Pseudomonas amygdali TaxID=47877 RepID=UPI001379F382|nr:hypothetical protein [Pseudomonas amygdali]
MRQSVINATHVSVGRMSLQPLKDMQVALMKSRYTAASAQREEVTKPKDLTQDRQSIHYKHHEDVSPASRPYRRQIPVQLHQSALWAAYIREHLDGLPSLFSTPLQRSRSGRRLHNAKGKRVRQRLCSEYFY